MVTYFCNTLQGYMHFLIRDKNSTYAGIGTIQ